YTTLFRSQRGINQSDDIALVDAGVKIDIQLRDGARDLRSNLHGDHRVDCSRGFHDIVDIAPLNLGGEVLWLSAVVQSKADKQPSQDHQACHDVPTALCFHPLS